MDDTTSTTPEVILPTEPATVADPVNKGPNKLLKSQVAACRAYKKKLIKGWDTNISYRKGSPFTTVSDEDRIAVNLDWSYTKMKQSSLFSQVPAVRINHPPQTASKEVGAWLHNFEQRINDNLIQGGIETALDECLPDCINASGFGVVIASHDTITRMVDVPVQDLKPFPPPQQEQIKSSGFMPDGTPLQWTQAPDVLDQRYLVSRISPSDFLWPLSFVGSDFDNSPWIGHRGKVLWAEAVRNWKLDETQKAKYVGGQKSTDETLNDDTEKEIGSEEFVTFDELFYKEHKFNPGATSFDAIHHLVFIEGQEEPVVDESWKGQRPDAKARNVLGSTIYPIRVLTLTYITDEAIPPSDSAVARPQVNELSKARTQEMLQRQHNIPILGFDVNRLDPAIQIALMRGTWLGMVPIQGNPEGVITQISRSSFPPENLTFDVKIKADLSMLWQTGQEPLGNDIETKGEATVVQTNFQTRIGRERAKVGAFFCSIAQVIGGLVSLYEDPASFGQGFSPAISRTLAYSILADSTVLLNSQQRIKQIDECFNLYAKTGWLDMESILKERVTLTGLDAAVCVRPPQPSPPELPNMSVRFSGAEDVMNPLMLAFLIKTGQAPDAKLIDQAKKLIAEAVEAPTPEVPQLGPDGKLLPPTGIGPMPQIAPPKPGDAHPDLSAASKVNQRIVDRNHD